MRSRESIRLSLSLAGAVLLSLLLAGQSLAATWSEPYAIAAPNWLGWVDKGSLTTLDETTVVVVYARENDDVARVMIRRSTDGGSSWQAPRMLADRGWRPVLAGLGADVDVVWIWNGRVRYARSTDAGKTFAQPVAVSPRNGHAAWPGVARGPNGLVAITWQEPTCQESTVIKARVSTNGGRSFGPVAAIATEACYAEVAAGEGVIHVVSSSTAHEAVRVDRSLDAGATWSVAAEWPLDLQGFYATYGIAAEGDEAFIAFATQTAIRYRLTSDRGATWSRSRALLDRHYPGDPSVSLDGGMFRAAFSVYARDELDSGVFYRESTDGRNWTVPRRVSPVGDYNAYAGGVGFTNKTIVLFKGEDDGIYVRTRP